MRIESRRPRRAVRCWIPARWGDGVGPGSGYHDNRDDDDNSPRDNDDNSQRDDDDAGHDRRHDFDRPSDDDSAHADIRGEL